MVFTTGPVVDQDQPVISWTQRGTKVCSIGTETVWQC